MKTSTLCFVVCLGVLAIPAASVEPALTIYNQDFGVVRENIRLDLQKGVNQVAFTETTAHLEPDSVMLRDPQGKRALRILEQNFRADPISSGLLLSLYEGKTIDFLIQTGEEKTIVPGKIIRSGYVYHAQGLQRYNQQYYQAQMAYAQGPGSEPIVEFIDRHDEYITEMVKRGTQFMQHVANRTEPVVLEAMAAPVDATKTYDFAHNNHWASAAVDWLSTKDAADACKTAEKILKALVPEDAKKCFGHSIQITRDRAGRLSLRKIA